MKVLKQVKLMLVLGGIMSFSSCSDNFKDTELHGLSTMAATAGSVIDVSTVAEVNSALAMLTSGQTLALAPGEYKDLQLVVTASGTVDNPIVIKSSMLGQAAITGNCKVELRGEHIILEGFLFRDGARLSGEWSSHGPGLIAIYGSHNRVTQCVVDNFNDVTSAYLTTSLTSDGTVPQYCRIDHCSFMNKTTKDQVVNLNNTPEKSTVGDPGIPMYHRLDHCYFYNPFKKSGNAGGGVRIGFWRKDYGRCLVDSNLFVSQNSEPEIITSKSMENVFYANTFTNCDGTMNFRHGDNQVMIHNHFLSYDTTLGCGGAFIWGSGHLIAGNYFQLAKTMKSRGYAALYMNAGAKATEHALAYDITVANNYFANNNGYAVDLQGLKARRVTWCADNGLTYEDPYDLRFTGNVFANKSFSYDFFQTDAPAGSFGTFDNDRFTGANLGVTDRVGMDQTPFTIAKNPDTGYYALPSDYTPSAVTYPNITGIDLNLSELASAGILTRPVKQSETGALWYSK
ncbi:chondroitinase-B domain-containing protein [Prolixibacteraceae bacterium]|nr:chondroitinase-B domain-containing protein [Prolixibacteraceae bacterium]